jgi:hypothetical protein
MVALRDDGGDVQTGPVASTTTTTTRPAVPDADPLVARDGESAKDLAERVALQVFGEELVTMDVTDGADGSTVVHLEDLVGDRVLAHVVVAGDEMRLDSMASPELDQPGATGQLTSDGHLVIELPPAGHLRLVALDDQLRESQSVGTDKPAGPLDLDGAQFIADHPYVLITLETIDGHVIRGFGRQ